MNMHILSESQFEKIITALDDARFVLDTCQHVELDLSKPRQTIPLPTGEELVRTTDVHKPKSQSKARKTRRGKRGVAVLTEAKVLEIKRQLAAGGKSVASIARDFGVHITTINCIKWGKTWKHVSIHQESTPVEVHG
jgi:hypothetical protein